MGIGSKSLKSNDVFPLKGEKSESSSGSKGESAGATQKEISKQSQTGALVLVNGKEENAGRSSVNLENGIKVTTITPFAILSISSIS